ncbi:hypothetical protein SKAU_G00019560 [Synaphobranchus kaupii]|uniref:Uncharacterized protein n=1 Tax=Synaphobranchus kaupii TaxID=118154 RepID=A0A9Q1JCZ7_SYNKA|nr:hypothetical protein SKAU_G00019560 [Synaphobranchus kaupii]
MWRTTSSASLQKKTQELATLVRPASPTDNTLVKLAGNALNWLHTCMQILEEHYLENLGHLTKKLENIHLSNWPEAFQVATRENHGCTTPGLVPEGVASSETDTSPRKPYTTPPEKQDKQWDRRTPQGLGTGTTAATTQKDHTGPLQLWPHT